MNRNTKLKILTFLLLFNFIFSLVPVWILADENQSSSASTESSTLVESTSQESEMSQNETKSTENSETEVSSVDVIPAETVKSEAEVPDAGSAETEIDNSEDENMVDREDLENRNNQDETEEIENEIEDEVENEIDLQNLSGEEIEELGFTLEDLEEPAKNLFALRSSRSSNTFKSIYKKRLRGNITITGNALQKFADNSIPGSNDHNLQKKMAHLDFDGDLNTENSSGAFLKIKPGAKVEKAFLVWSATTTKGSKAYKSPIKFKIPDGDYKDVYAMDMGSFGKEGGYSYLKYAYANYADVTEEVKKGGQGYYWVADIDQRTDEKNTYGGWALITVFSDENEEYNDLNIFWGREVVRPGSTPNIKIDGFETPPAGEVKAKLGVVAWEGDAGMDGDKLILAKNAQDTAPVALSDANSPVDNFFNSVVSSEGELITDRFPNNANNLGIDAKIINIDGKLENGQEEAEVRFETSGDYFYPTVLTTQIQLYAPEIIVDKSVVNVSNTDGDVVEGDVLKYIIDIENRGKGNAERIQAIDIIPEGLEFVPKSIKDGEGKTLTDAADDDSAEYQDGKVIFRVGKNPSSSSSATIEGTLIPAERYKLEFQVKVVDIDKVMSFKNTVKVSYEGTGGSFANSTSDGEVEIKTFKPEISLTKTADRNKLVSGETITFTFLIKNTGNNDLTELRLEDKMPNLKLTPDLGGIILKPGDSISRRGYYTVTQEDVDKGFIKNDAKVTATAKNGNTSTDVSSEASISVPSEQFPDFTFNKSASPRTYSEVGEEITFTFTIKNTGNISITNLAIEDTLAGLSDISYGTKALKPGEETSATATYSVTQDDLDWGTIVNTATVNAQFANDKKLDNKATATIIAGQAPAFEFTKSTDTKKLVLGDIIEFIFKIKNTGNVTLNKLKLEDDFLGLGPISFNKESLAPGDEDMVKFSYKVKQEDIDSARILNTATATVEIPKLPGQAQAKQISHKAHVEIPADYKPLFDFQKEAWTTNADNSEGSIVTKDYIKAGNVITYKFVVENTGNKTLKNIEITDAMDGLSPLEYTCNGKAVDDLSEVELMPGQKLYAKARYTITQKDVDRGTIENAATAKATPPPKLGETDAESISIATSVKVPAEFKPNFTIEKNTTITEEDILKLKDGDEIEYTFTFTNTGNVTLTGIEVIDTKLENPNVDMYKHGEKVTELAPGEIAEGKATYKVTQPELDKGDIINTVEASATPPPRLGPNEPIKKMKINTIKRESKPDLEFKKHSDKTSLVAGETIEYTLELKNT
ncbi:MAG: hypothetical protein Q4P65_04025, partial [Eubacteriales bacterium]|nr:hypothetical protein [Eubacteriales bacterium]